MTKKEMCIKRYEEVLYLFEEKVLKSGGDYFLGYCEGCIATLKNILKDLKETL